MNSKYVDNAAIVQVIGAVYNNPSLLDFTDKYIVTEQDFQNDFHKIVFGSIYKVHEMGVKEINLNLILDYLSSRPKSEAIFRKEKGEEWLIKASNTCSNMSFDYYYHRLKKMSLLRAYDNYGIDVSDIYDPDNIFDVKKKQIQEDWLDNASLEDIAERVDKKIEEIRYEYVNNSFGEILEGGEGIEELIQRFKDTPEAGIKLYGGTYNLINEVTRGARLKKFYIRSAPTGVGKTRAMVADACYIGCEKIYDDSFGWIKTGSPPQPTLFIATEQDLSEIQTLMLAFLSNVNEEHILTGMYEGNEEERVLEAARQIKNGKVYIRELPDFSLQDVENEIKRAIRDYDVKYVFMDYIQTSMKILEEITRRSGGVRLREDNVLFMLSTKLKDICNTYGIFIESATQLSGDYMGAETPDQSLLRGAKSIADKIDVGEVLLPVSQKDLEALATISSSFDTPTLKLSVYKNRRGKFKGVYLWCKADLGCCRIDPMFATTWNYELVKVNNLNIIVDEEKGAF